MANTQNIVRYLTFFLTVVAAVFAVLATGGNYWMNLETVIQGPLITQHIGLWKLCSFHLCYEIRNDSGTYNIHILF